MQARHCMQHARQYHTAKLEKTPRMPVSPEDRHQSLPYFFPSYFFIVLPCQVKPTRKMNKKIVFQNSLMQDANEHYFNVRRPHDRTIECVRKKDSIAYSQL